MFKLDIATVLKSKTIMKGVVYAHYECDFFNTERDREADEECAQLEKEMREMKKERLSRRAYA